MGRFVDMSASGSRFWYQALVPDSGTVEDLEIQKVGVQKIKKKKKKKNTRIPGAILADFCGKISGSKEGPGPFSDTKPPDSSDIIIKPYSFPTFTWIYLIQVLRDKPAFSRF